MFRFVLNGSDTTQKGAGLYFLIVYLLLWRVFFPGYEGQIRWALYPFLRSKQPEQPKYYKRDRLGEGQIEMLFYFIPPSRSRDKALRCCPVVSYLASCIIIAIFVKQHAFCLKTHN